MDSAPPPAVHRGSRCAQGSWVHYMHACSASMAGLSRFASVQEGTPEQT